MNTKHYSVIVVDSESSSSDLSPWLRTTDRGLASFATYSSSSPETTRALLDLGGLDAAVCHVAPGSRRDLETLSMIRRVAPEVAIVVVAASRDRSLAPWAIDAGAQDCLFEDEVGGGVLQRAVRCAVERRRGEAALHRLGSYDPATGLLNQKAFEDLLNRWLHRSSRGGRETFALLALEVLELGEAVRRSGRRFAEAVLGSAARRLRRAARPGDSLAILDGDQFVLLLPAVASFAQGRVAALRIANRLARPMEVRRQRIEPTPRWSVTPFRSSFREAREMLEAALNGLSPRPARLPPAATAPAAAAPAAG